MKGTCHEADNPHGITITIANNNMKHTCHEADNEADNPDRIGRKIQFTDLSHQKH